MKGEEGRTVKPSRNRIMVLNHALIDEYPLRPLSGVDLNWVVRCVDLVDDEGVGEARTSINQQVSLSSSINCQHQPSPLFSIFPSLFLSG